MMQNINTKLTDEELNSFIQLLTDRTGIIPHATHKEGIKNYIEASLLEKNINAEEYKNLIISNPQNFSEFINESTVNETYFFREEKQFILLRDKIFKTYKNKSSGKSINMWSAACSYGEEAYSLALLALSCGITPNVIASDINSEVLEHCANGVFLGTSLRPMDGNSFHNLVLPYKREDRKIEFNSEIKEHIKTIFVNLSELDSPSYKPNLPKNQDIIFLRNVFIYFNQELRSRILKTIAEECLSDDGYLFVSISEVAQLDYPVIPSSLEKISDGNIFYFHKKGGKANG